MGPGFPDAREMCASATAERRSSGLTRRFGCVATALLLISGLCVTRGMAADWPQFLGPERNNRSNETGLLSRWPEGGPPRLWEAPVGKGFSGIAVVGSRAYTMFNRTPHVVLACFDIATGKEHWARPVEPEYKNNKVVENWGPRATPTIDDGRVYAYGPPGVLLVVDAESGAPIYRRELLREFGGKTSEWGLACSPLIEGDRLYLTVGGPGGAFCCLDKNNGRVLWKTGTHKIGYVSPMGITVEGRRQIIFASVDHYFGVDAGNGEVRWSLPFKCDYDCNIPTPIVNGQQVFLSCFYAHKCMLLEVQPQAVKPIWQSDVLLNYLSNSVLVDGFLYGFNKKDLKCVEWRTGQQRWVANRHRRLFQGSLTYADGRLYVLSERGDLSLVAARPDRIEILGEMPGVLGRRCWTAPTVAQGRLFVRDEEKMLCFDIRAR